MTRLPTLLFVEDNAGDVLLLKQAFAERSFQLDVQVIPTGDQALRFLQGRDTAHATTPDLLLFDLHLPRVSGYDLVAYVRSNPLLARIPWYIFSESDSDPRYRSTELPKERCLAKPSTWDGYLALVDRLIAVLSPNGPSPS